MTVTADRPGAVDKPDLVNVTIDGIEISVPKGTLVIRAAELLGIAIPRFCDHPLLDPVGACRQCLVEVEGQAKPFASCTTTCTPGMVVKTQYSSQLARTAQAGVMELLLINHPLDCPVCDKGGECPLQNQAMSAGRADSRFRDAKLTFAKPVAISSQVLLDRERCVQCARCTRFSDQIAGDAFIDLFERGAHEQIGIASGRPFDSYFSGNTVQICPVGALTGTSYRFRARPFDLQSTPSACEHCASGCALRSDWRRGKITRRLAGDDPAVNEEWNCDKGRWAFAYLTQPDRLTDPAVRGTDGWLRPAPWSRALEVAADRLDRARGRVGVLVGGRLTVEDAYGYAKFTRVALGSDDIDFRARPASAEEAQFLAARVAGRGLGVTYADLEAAPAVLLVDLEPAEESPIVLLRLRKAYRKRGLRVFAVGPMATRGLAKVGGTLIATVPGGEAVVLAEITAGAGSGAGAQAARAVREPGAVVLVGERAARCPGTLSAAARLADATGARLAWVPRRAGDRGAVEAGALAGLLPGGRPLADPVARAEVAAVWGPSLPATPGRDGTGILRAAAAGELAALVVAGVDPADLPDPALFQAAVAATGFVLSLEIRSSAVTERADVVLPVAAMAEKAGSYLDWEGRPRVFDLTLHGTGRMSDARVLHAVAAEMGVGLGLPDAAAARAELAELGPWTGPRPAAPTVALGTPARPGPGQAVLATWPMLLDDGRMQDGEPHLAGTARPAVARTSTGTAARLGLQAGSPVTVRTGRGALSLPLEIGELPDGVVWLPTRSGGCTVRATLAADSGDVVDVTAGGAA